jgi:hypothetical protein
MYTITRKFISCCRACFLQNKGTRQVKLGVYPAPSYPMEEINMDLAENLNPINGFAHLLVIQCALTDFTHIIPLKSKGSEVVVRALQNSVLQIFNVKRIHSDNGPCFRSRDWLMSMAALNIQIIGSAALHPEGRGQIERLVGTIKTLLKKMLSIKTSLNWEFLPYLCAKIINSTVSPKTGFTPQSMVFGTMNENVSPLNLDITVQPHHMVLNSKQYINDLNSEIKDMVSTAHAKLMDLKVETNERLNPNRITKHFKPNEYVFVLDRLQVPGSSRPLKTKFHPSPYVVVKSYPTTTLVKRISDGYQTSYSNNDLKVYDKTSPLFKDLPKEVSKVLLHDFQNFLSSDFCTIAKFDDFEILNAIELFDPVDHDRINQTLIDEGSINLFEDKSQYVPINPVPNTDVNTSQWEKINQALENNHSIPTMPDSTELTTAGITTNNPELTAPIEFTNTNTLVPTTSSTNTNSPVNTELHKTDGNEHIGNNEIDSASSDEDHETESNKPTSVIDEPARSINLRSGTKIFPGRQKKVRFQP